MGEFISNIEFGPASNPSISAQQKWERYASRFVAAVEDFLAASIGHCCYCDPAGCNPSIPQGDCGLHQL